MDDLFKNLYKTYGRYVNAQRAFPSMYDGAKLVERRLLYTLYEIARSTKLVKSATVVGHAMGHYHPHGDSALYSSLVNLVDNGLAIGQGNWGDDNGIEPNPPAAMRYTEVRSQPEILDIAFEYIKDVPYDKIELDFDEPLFLPTRLPICLIGTKNYISGIGFGYKTVIPIYKRSDLVRRLFWLAKDKQGPEPIIKPINHCKYNSKDDDFKQLLTTGSAKLDYKGIYKVDGNDSVVITNIPPFKSFRKDLIEKLSDEISVTKVLGFQDESKDSSKVRLTILRPRMLKMNELKEKLDKLLVGSVTFSCNVCNDDGDVVTMSIDDMLMTVYNLYRKVVTKVTQRQIDDIDKRIGELELIAKIKPLLREELKLNPDDINVALTNIANGLKEDFSRIKEVCDKYTISRIFRIKTETDEIENSKKDLIERLRTIVQYIWKEKYSHDLQNN